MSALGGLAGPRGWSPDPERVERLAVALGRRGPARCERALLGAVAFVHAALRPGDPGLYRRGELLLAWDGRLDNRDSLEAALGRAEGPGGDLGLIALAYGRWGPALCEHLVGDYALAIHDGHRLLLARDPMGVRPLFHARTADGGGLAWGSTLRAVREASGVTAAVDEGWIAGYLAHAIGPEETPYREVRAVAPGHTLVITEDGTRNDRVFWTPGPRPAVSLSSDREYEERFAELFVDAVRCRLSDRAPVLAQLSGGVDSSSIVCVADALIREGRAGATELLTASEVYDRSKSSDERHFISQVEERIGRKGRHIVEADGAAFAGLEAPEGEYPAALECVRVRHRAYPELMAARGAYTLLSGFGGDNVAHAEFEPALPLADLLRSGRLPAFLRQLGPWQRSGGGVPYPRLIAGSLMLAFLPAFPRRLVLARQSSLAQCLQPDFLRSHVLDRLSGMVMAGAGLPSRRRQIASIQVAIRTVSWLYDPGRQPYETAYPFLHQPLVDFCLATPGEQFMRTGETRSLHRRALRAWLPPGIARRRSKRGPDESVHRDLAAEWNRLRPLLEDPQVVRRGWIRELPFRRMLDEARFGRQGTQPLFLLETIALEAWLRAQGHP